MSRSYRFRYGLPADLDASVAGALDGRDATDFGRRWRRREIGVSPHAIPAFESELRRRGWPTIALRHLATARWHPHYDGRLTADIRRADYRRFRRATAVAVAVGETDNLPLPPCSCPCGW